MAGATVDLLAKPVGSKNAWAVVGTGTTAADGSVSITASSGGSTPGTGCASTRRRPACRWQPGDQGRRARRRARSRSAARTSRRVRHERPAPSRRATRSATRVVTLQTYDPATKTWTDTGTDRTSSTGVAQFIRPSAPGTDYRLVYVGHAVRDQHQRDTDRLRMS